MTKLFLTSIAMLLLAAGAAQAKQCDTLHTSDTRGIWKCGDVCVRAFGNPPSEIIFDEVGTKQSKVVRLTFEWKRNVGTASLNGKQCKVLPQSYDYDKQK